MVSLERFSDWGAWLHRTRWLQVRYYCLFLHVFVS